MTPLEMLGETSANKRGNKTKPRMCRIRIQKSRVVKRKRPDAEWGTGAERGGNKMQDGQKKKKKKRAGLIAHQRQEIEVIVLV
jgi:hypothetical protein